jgi:pimeloyl-ACP methyl ester carboxylesterase
LALLDTNARADVPERTAEREKFIAMAQAGKFAEVNAALTPRYLHPNHRGERFVKIVEQMADDVGVDGFIRQQRAIMGRIDSRPRLGEIRCPTRLIFGRHDKIGSIAHQEEMLAAIPGARLDLLEDAGHLVPIERPERANALLRSFIKT